MTKSSPGRIERRLRRDRGRPKKNFASDPDRETIDVAEILHLVGFNRREAYDLAITREGRLVEEQLGKISFQLSMTTVAGRESALRQKSDRESTDADRIRRALIAARMAIVAKARDQAAALRLIDSLQVVLTYGGPEKLERVVKGLWHGIGDRRKRRVAKRIHDP